MYQAKQKANDPAAEICQRVWMSIAEKRLRPGTRLKEEELAEIFQVNRARVRQALSILQSDGLVVIQPNRGAFVAEPSVDEARDVFHVRKLIEARIIERLAGRLSPEDFPRLEAHLAEEKAAMARGDTSEGIRLSGGFHMLLAELSGSDFLTVVLRDLISRSSLITAMYRDRHVSNCGPDEHEGLIRALRAGDIGAAQRSMREHLEHVEHELDLSEDATAVRDLRQALL